MLARLFLACAVAAFAVGAQPAEAASAKAAAKTGHATRAKDWSLVVSPTPAGGFVMGNPDAAVKLVEYGSLTCSHCAHFDKDAVPALISNFVKPGAVSWEFRNYVRDPVDVSGALLTRCGGANRFFPLTRALFQDQRSWLKRVATAPQDELAQMQRMSPDKQFLAAARIAGFQQWGVAHGLPVAKSARCLTDSASIVKVVQMADDTTTQFPNFVGTPSFVINGTMIDFGSITEAEVWPTLESQIKAALAKAAPPISSTNGAVN